VQRFRNNRNNNNRNSPTHNRIGNGYQLLPGYAFGGPDFSGLIAGAFRPR
jgi:hypothetical protein